MQQKQTRRWTIILTHNFLTHVLTPYSGPYIFASLMRGTQTEAARNLATRWCSLDFFTANPCIWTETETDRICRGDLNIYNFRTPNEFPVVNPCDSVPFINPRWLVTPMPRCLSVYTAWSWQLCQTSICDTTP